MKEEKVFIPGCGIRLEGLLSVHEAFPFVKGMIACHPHPLYGGNMFNPVVAAAVEAAYEEGFSTLRFNFRGVGQSEGAYDEGRGEREDVKSAIDFLWQRSKDSSPGMVLMGYSFGAWAGFPVGVEDKRIDELIAVAPPLAMYDFGSLKGCRKRKLFVAGDRDDYCPVETLKDWFKGLDEPKSLDILQGADHFLFSHTRAVSSTIREFLRESFPSR
jgi:uncharacterized protein